MSGAGLTIRCAERADVAAVLGLWAAGRSGHASQPDTVGAVERLLADRPGALLVAERRSVVVGTLIAASDGWQGKIGRFVRNA